jgi:hypothetical protein
VQYARVSQRNATLSAVVLVSVPLTPELDIFSAANIPASSERRRYYAGGVVDIAELRLAGTLEGRLNAASAIHPTGAGYRVLITLSDKAACPWPRSYLFAKRLRAWAELSCLRSYYPTSWRWVLNCVEVGVVLREAAEPNGAEHRS